MLLWKLLVDKDVSTVSALDFQLCSQLTSVDMHEDSHVLLHRIRVAERDNWHACRHPAFCQIPLGLEEYFELCQ